MIAETLISPWSKTENEVLKALQVNGSEGLSLEEVKARIKSFGLNALRDEPKTSPLTRLITQLKSPVVIILLIATVVTAFLGDGTAKKGIRPI